MNEVFLEVVKAYPEVGLALSLIGSTTVIMTIIAPITPWLWDDRLVAWGKKGLQGKVFKFINSFSLIKPKE